MPTTLYQGEEREYILKTLSSEIDFLNSKIEEMHQTDKELNDGVKILEEFNQPFTDDSQLYRRTFAFIAVLAIENDIVLKNLLFSKSEKEDLPLIKNGIITMQEGCKRLIGFYNNKGGDEMIKKSLLYKISLKFKRDFPEIYSEFVQYIGRFRDKLQSDNTKKLRDTLVHFQEGNGEFNPFTFIEDISKIEVNDVFSILFDYCIFLRYTTQLLGILIKLDRI